MQIYPNQGGFHCFVCNENGDVISFVQKLFGLEFKDACKKMDQDFCLRLGVGETRTKAEREAAERAYQEKLNAKRRYEKRRKLLYMLYNAAYNRFTFLDILKTENKPKKPGDPISSEYIYACTRIDGAWNDVEEAAEKLRKFEEKNKQEV